MKSAYEPKSRWPIRPELFPVSVALRDRKYLCSPPDGMLVHRRITPPELNFISGLGHVSQKLRKLFGRGPFSLSVSKNSEVFTPETSCMKGAFVHIKNT